MVKINFGENGQGPKCVPHIPHFKLKRKTFILLVCIITIFSSCNKSEKAVHPNIILILTDDQGWGDLSISGNTNIETPNIDRLAETGVTFDRFYVSPVCSPTRAELLTGRYHPIPSTWWGVFNFCRR